MNTSILFCAVVRIVDDVRIVSDRGLLIAYEEAPKSLSIGLVGKNDERRRPKVFLNYADDQETAWRIADALAESGIQVTFDSTEVSGGSIFFSTDKATGGISSTNLKHE